MFRKVVICFCTLVCLVLSLSALAFSEKANAARWPAGNKIIAVIPPDFPPTYFRDEKTGQASGFAVDTLNAIARKTGLDVDYIFEKSWTEIENKVLSGEADVIPNLGISERRKINFAFTDITEEFPINLYVRAQDNKVTKLEKGLNVGVIKGSIAYDIVSKVEGVNALLYENFQTLVFDLIVGQIDAVVGPTPNISKLALEVGVEDKIKTTGEPLLEVKRAIAVRKDNTLLLERLNKEIRVFSDSPEYRNLYLKWFGKPAPLLTTEKILLIALTIIIGVILLMAIWRHFSLIKLNTELIANIEERKKTETALRESEESFRMLFDKSADVIFIVDTSGRIVDFNDIAVERYKYSREELLSMKVSQLDSPSDAKNAPERLARVQKYGTAVFEVEHMTKDGVIIPGEVNSRLIMRNGVPLLLSSCRDITDRKRAEERLKESEERFRDLFENANDLIQIVSPEGRILYVNRSWRETLGYSEEEIWGMSLADIIDPTCDEHCNVTFGKILSEGSVKDINTTLVAKDGRKVFLEISGRCKYKDGKPESVRCMCRDVTSHIKAEEEQRKLISIIETSSDMIGIADLDGNLLYLNDAGQRLVGLDSLEDVLHKSVRQFHPEEDSLKFEGEIMQSIMQMGSWNGEIAYRHFKTGELIPVEMNAFVIRDSNTNRPIALANISRDITERKMAEEALLKSEERYRSIVETTTEWIWEIDLAGNHTFSNWGSLAILGYHPDEFVGSHAISFMHEDDRREVEAALPRLIAEKQGWREWVLRWRHKDGTYRYLESNASPVINAVGECVGYLGADRDITERKLAEEELREKENKYRLLFESANDGIFIQYENGFIDCNEKGAEMYGLTKEEIIGRSPSEFAPERQPDGRLSSEVAEEKIRAALSGFPQLFEWQPVRADGSPFNVEITLSRLELGGKICLQAIVRDISERKKLERELLKTQKLESIGTLAGGIAHDFNNLLQGVFGYISMAQLTFDQKEKSLAMLEQAEKALHQSVNLTTQLLTFSKGGKPAMKKMMLKPVIENAVRFSLSGSQVDYRINLDEDLWMVEADEGQIGQVIQNIVINADQAMPLGGSIEITAKNVQSLKQILPHLSREGRDVAISVKDTGIGIPQQYLEKIFDPYFTTKEKGSGLGLATSYSIIKNHGGEIIVTSELGKGTTFFIYLPAIETEKEIKETPAATSVVRKGKILVMDDEDLVLNIAGEMIQALGHDVDIARDGESAIEKYRAAKESGNPFDVVILDLTIRGGMGGRETVERLLSMDNNVKAIVSSGYSGDAVVSEYYKYGFRTRLSKPYKLEVLRDTLNALLS